MDSSVEFVAVDNPHANKLTVQILATVAQHERFRTVPLVSERTPSGESKEPCDLKIGTLYLAPRWTIVARN
jgi:hypothetical protein